MAVHNSYIGQLFNEVADLLEIEDANPFRVRAYRNASRVVSQWPQSFAELVARGEEVPKLPGLGADLRGRVAEAASTGRLAVLEDVRKRVPQGLSALLRIPGLGPKRVLVLRDRLGIRGLPDLERAARRGALEKLPGFGDKTAQSIREAVGRAELAHPRLPLVTAEQIAEPLLAYLRATPGVSEAVVAGSYRRRQETVGDLDFLVACDRPARVMERFVGYEEVRDVLSQGPTRSTVLLRFGVQADLRVVARAAFGAALHYFTGSKAHNIAVRMLGVRRGLKINEYGVFRSRNRIAGRTEEEVYRQVDLPYIEPELREMRGELEAAREGRLPQLVTATDLRGDLHAHTRATDGKLGLEELAELARKRGYEYLAVTDHSRHLTVANGLDPKRLAQQLRAIDRYNERTRGLRLLKSIEVDILEDGSLDLPDSILRQLDLTVCSVHSKFDLSERKQTERVIRAMDNPYFTILGHPTGRLIGSRKGLELSMERLIAAARDRGCFLEVNSQPERMDLTDIYCRMAKDMGVRVSISTDAHTAQDLDGMRWGLAQARRGWLEAPDVLNTLPLAKLLKIFRRR